MFASKALCDAFGGYGGIQYDFSVSVYLHRKHIEKKYILREKTGLGHVSTIKGIISAVKESGPLCHLGKKTPSRQEFGRFLVYFCFNSPLMRK